MPQTGRTIGRYPPAVAERDALRFDAIAMTENPRCAACNRLVGSLIGRVG